VDVTVIWPNGKTCTLTDAFTYDGSCLTGCPGCITNSIDPAQGPLSGGSMVTIEGAGFQPGSFVAFGSTLAPATVIIDSLEIQAVTPPSPVEGYVDVTVSNAAGSVVCRIEDGFYYGAGCSITAVDPTDLCGWVAETVTIFGDGFQVDAEVFFFNRIAAPTPALEVEVVDSMTVVAKVPDQLTTVSPSYDVEVVNPDGTRCFLAPAFNVTRGTGAPCTLSSISPSVGSVAGGETVTITGSDLPEPARVFFEANEAVVISNTDTEIVAEAPPGKRPGPILVRVIDDACTRLPGMISYTYQ
jgi:hypothetical protein